MSSTRRKNITFIPPQDRTTRAPSRTPLRTGADTGERAYPSEQELSDSPHPRQPVPEGRTR